MQAILQILTIALAVFLLYRMFKGGGCCGGGHSHGPKSQVGGCCSHGFDTDRREDSHTQIETHKDPICGMYVSEKNAVTRQINGQTVYFCSENCAKEYEKRNS